MKIMRRQLKRLLRIHGVSSDEKNVRRYLEPIMNHQMDKVIIDDYGNLLAEKTYGTGKGATIMLSAHMDTVKGVLKDRKLIEEGDIISSSKGALGADDRAGIAIILAVLRNMSNVSFNGKIKVAFSREEEVGCIGSSKIDTKWYNDVDLAIIVDRRGNRDIVVGCFSAFCSNEVGEFMEEASEMADMNYKCVEGGISDAVTFSENGINSVNISAGYMNEHTEREFVSLSGMRDSVKLIMQSLAIVNDFYKGFTVVPKTNKWILGWSYNSAYSGQNYYEDQFDGVEDQFEDSIWAEVSAQAGDCYIYELGGDVIIQQGEDEIALTREELSFVINQLFGVKY